MNDLTLQDVRILLVEDHDDTRELLFEVLRLHGAVVQPAPDPLEALQHLRTQPFDVVVTDLAMPGATGFWLLEQIRRNEECRTLPVIAVSGTSMKPAEAAGFAAYFRKPADPFELCETIASVITAAR